MTKTSINTPATQSQVEKWTKLSFCKLSQNNFSYEPGLGQRKSETDGPTEFGLNLELTPWRPQGIPTVYTREDRFHKEWHIRSGLKNANKRKTVTSDGVRETPYTDTYLFIYRLTYVLHNTYIGITNN